MLSITMLLDCHLFLCLNNRLEAGFVRLSRIPISSKSFIVEIGEPAHPAHRNDNLHLISMKFITSQGHQNMFPCDQRP